MDIELASNFTLFQPGRSTLTPSYFLCMFVNVDNPTIMRPAIAQSVGDELGPIVLELTEQDDPDPESGQVELIVGDWQLTVYEQSSSTNVDPVSSGRVVWTELVRVNQPSEPIPARDPYQCPGSDVCPFDIELYVDSVLVDTINDVDPCVNNTLNINWN